MDFNKAWTLIHIALPDLEANCANYFTIRMRPTTYHITIQFRLNHKNNRMLYERLA